jgi:hypothetical protein
MPPPEPGSARREAHYARSKHGNLGRLLKRLTHASALKEGAHGGTMGSPVPNRGSHVIGEQRETKLLLSPDSGGGLTAAAYFREFEGMLFFAFSF